MHLIGALLILSLLALLFGAAAYLAMSQHSNQPGSQQRYPVWRNYRPWPDKPTLRKPLLEEKIRQRAELDHQLKKRRLNH